MVMSGNYSENIVIVFGRIGVEVMIRIVELDVCNIISICLIE